MSLEEFEQRYATESGITVEQLHEMGLYGIPCDCDAEGCEGWQVDWEHREERAATRYQMRHFSRRGPT